MPGRAVVRAVLLVAALGFVCGSLGAEPPKVPVPPSPFLPVVYRYADAMLEKGRDTYGPQKTGLLLSALDRATFAPLTNQPTVLSLKKPSKPAGANLQYDENLLRLLYTLSELSSKPKYREAADAELKWMLENARSPVTDLLPWGESMSWDPINNRPVDASGAEEGGHRFFRPWMLWDRCFMLAPDASRKVALGLWEHQIANHETGAFHRRAAYFRHLTMEGTDSPRDAGFYIRTWAAAYAHTKDEQFLRPIDVLLGRYEKNRHTGTGLIAEFSSSTNSRMETALSLAIDCDGAAHLVPGPLAARLRAFAAQQDEVFCSLPHEMRKSGGFLFYLTQATAKLFPNHTSLWDEGFGLTTARMGMMCVSRYENTGKVGYRELIHAAADAYMNSLPAENEDAWPVTFGQAISLEVAAWRSTANQEYLDRARALADFAVQKFFDQGPLPRASLHSHHYETITGADTLALGLMELHLHILGITAVRCPPNTIDR